MRNVTRADVIAELVEGLGDPESPPKGWSALLELAWTWGQRTNLTGAKDRASLCEILFLDAWQLWRSEMVPQDARVLDVGAGVGAPTLPLLIARSDLSATLVEPRRKRVAFLRHVMGALGLEERVEVLEAKVDTERPELDGAPFDVALSRATFEPAEWLRVGSQLGTNVIVFLASQETPALAGWEVTRRVDYRVPSSGAPRAIVRYSATGLGPSG